MSEEHQPTTDLGRREVAALGQVLHETRVAARLSVETLAAASGVSAGSISQLERGRGNPSFLTLRRLAAALGVPLGRFLQGPETGPMVVRADRRKRPHLPTEHGLVYELLTPDLGGALEVLRSQIPAGVRQPPPAVPTRRRGVCALVAVMTSGQIVEAGDAVDVYERPQHDYTRKLLAAIPADTPAEARRRRVNAGRSLPG